MPSPVEIQMDGITMRGKFPIPTLDVSHKRLHEGTLFTTTKLFSGAGVIANDASVNFLISVGAAYSPHFIVDMAAGGDFTSQFFEGSTVSANGTELSLFNRFRPSSNTTDTDIFYAPTVTGDGTGLQTSFLPGGRAGQAVGGQDGGFDLEMVLSKSTLYLYRATNISGQAKAANFAFHFYENRGN